MEAKDYLKQARQADRHISAMLERRRRWAELERWHTPETATAVRDAQRELDARIDAYVALVRDIERRIDAVENPLYRDVLRYRYLNGWRWHVIAGRMGYSRDWLMRLHARALEALEV